MKTFMDPKKQSGKPRPVRVAKRSGRMEQTLAHRSIKGKYNDAAGRLLNAAI